MMAMRSGADLSDGRPAVDLAQPAPDDQAAADPEHHRLSHRHHDQRDHHD